MSKIGRLCREKIKEEIVHELKMSDGVFVTSHVGLTVQDKERLRRSLRKVGAAYLVIKNSLGRLALQETNYSSLKDALLKSCGFVFGKEDPCAVSKVIIDFAKEKQSFEIRAGMWLGERLEPARIKELSQLPPRPVLLAQVAGVMMQPIAGLARVLSAQLRSLVVVLDRIKQKKPETSNQ